MKINRDILAYQTQIYKINNNTCSTCVPNRAGSAFDHRFETRHRGRTTGFNKHTNRCQTSAYIPNMRLVSNHVPKQPQHNHLLFSLGLDNSLPVHTGHVTLMHARDPAHKRRKLISVGPSPHTMKKMHMRTCLDQCVGQQKGAWPFCFSIPPQLDMPAVPVVLLVHYQFASIETCNARPKIK
jgi:hypothetical protein